MKILDRYILREAVTYFLISLSSFVGILLIIRILKFTSLIVNKGVSFSQIAMVFLSIIPTFLEIALPMAALLGVLLTFARFSGDSEIVVIRASGISLHQLLRPVLYFGIAATLVSFYISLELRPWGYKKLSESLFDIARTRSTSGLSEGVFNKLGKLTLYADKIDYSTGDLTDVLVDDRRDPNARKVVTAKEGLIVSDSAAQTISLHFKNGQIHEQSAGKYGITNFVINSIMMDPQDIYNPDAQKREPKFRELSLPELELERERLLTLLNEPIESGRISDKEIRSRSRKIGLEAQRRFSMPVAALILALVAFPLGIHPPRTQKTWGAGFSVMLGVAVFMIYYALLSIGLALGEAGKLNPFIALWLPNFVSAAVAIYLIRRIGSERWQSVVHGIEEIWDKISLILQRRLEA